MKTSKKDFELFKKECAKWLKYFGMTDWKAYYSHEYVNGGFACCKVEGIEGRNVVFCLSTDVGNRKDLDIPMTAFHEVWELILWPMEYIGTCRYTQPEEIRVARHAVIRMMENTVYQSLKK